MRRTPLLLTVALCAAGCAEPTPVVVERADAAAPPPTVAAPRDPALSGIVRREIEGRGAERYEIVASAPELRPELAGIVKVERRGAASFMARLALEDVLHDSYPWTVRVEISRFDVDVALPALTIGEAVELVPIVRIPWLDDVGERRGASDVAPRSR